MKSRAESQSDDVSFCTLMVLTLDCKSELLGVKEVQLLLVSCESDNKLVALIWMTFKRQGTNLVFFWLVAE